MAPSFDTPTAADARSRTRSTERRAAREMSKGALPFEAPPEQEEPSGKGHHHKLGMFKGVLVPTCENMWGVIIFLRFYTIVGYAGIGMTIVIVTLSFGVALLTALALSAIATCGSSHGLAGVYPMLARALGREVATATGLIYFLGIVCLAVLECLGATEELFMVAPSLKFGNLALGTRIWGQIFMASLTAFVGGGIQLVSKLGLAFFVVVVLTIFFLYVSILGAPTLQAHDQPARPTNVSASGSSGRMLGDMLGDDDMMQGRELAVANLLFPTGLKGDNFRNNWSPAYGTTADGIEMGFSACLSLFFPCFTGILSGANRANSLRDPTTAIPNGTLGAICFSYVMYMSLLILWGGVGTADFLQMEHGQIDTIFYPSVVTGQIGIVVSSLGQALQCLVVAPRLLCSIAASGTIRELKPLSITFKGEPKRALLVAYVIGAALIMLGSLELVAPLLSMCFLLCYACMNLNSCFLDLLKDPHWRPKWRYFHWSTGLVGFFLCCTVMFLIGVVYAVIAWCMCLGLLFYIVRNNVSVDWGSAVHGLRFHIAIRSLLSVDMKSHLDHNWKPQLLLLYTLREVEQLENNQEYDAAQGERERETARERRVSHESLIDNVGVPAPVATIEEIAGHTHEHMFSVAHQLRHGSGLIIAAAIMQMGEDQANHDLAPVIAAEEEERVMSSLMKEVGVQGFAMTVLTHDATEGKAYAIQCAGLGPLTPNTVMMGWPWWWKANPSKHVPEFLSTIHQATLRQKALLVCHNIKDFPNNDEPQTGYIDVWWIKHDGGLLLLISHLLQKHRVWRRCDLRLHLITEMGTDPQQLKDRVHKLLHRINITASVEEVIQIDTDSLMPYMKTSAKRERNEAIAEDVAQQTGQQTAENFLEGREDNTIDNPLDYVSHRVSGDGPSENLDAPRTSKRRSSITNRLGLGKAEPPRSGAHHHAGQTSALATFDEEAGGPAVAPAKRRHSTPERTHHQTPPPSPPAAAPVATEVAVPEPYPLASATPPPSPPAEPAPLSAEDELLGFINTHNLGKKASAELVTLLFSDDAKQMQKMMQARSMCTASALASPPPSPPDVSVADGKAAGSSSPTKSSPLSVPPGGPPSAPLSPSSNAKIASPNDAAAQAGRWSLLGASSKLGGSRTQLPTMPALPAQLDDEPSAGERSPKDMRRRSSPTPVRATPPNDGAAGNGGVELARTRADSGGRSMMSGLLKRGNTMENKAMAAATALLQEQSGGDDQDVLSPAIKLELASFMEKHGLDANASAELQQLFSSASKKMIANSSSAPKYRWDQIHEMIFTHSPNTSLVIVNLPDPPDVDELLATGELSPEHQMLEMTQFMEYMEGVAESLPRVLYVHGSGQEVINLDALA